MRQIFIQKASPKLLYQLYTSINYAKTIYEFIIDKMYLKKCPVCDSEKITDIGPYRHKSSIFDNSNRAECSSCELNFTEPMPMVGKIESYNKSYFISAHGGEANDRITKTFYAGIALLRASYVNQYKLNNKQNVKDVYELGPGRGYFAKAWQLVSMTDNYYATETDSACHAFLKETNITLCDMPCPNSVDLVVMSHVLEHVPDPIDFVQQATLSLRTNGMMFIEVPCMDWMHKKMDEPHILFFDKKSISILLERLNFKNIQLDYYGQTISSILGRGQGETLWNKIRGRMITSGFYYPFSIMEDGLNEIQDPLQRAVMKPFKAHKKSSEPAWWLRVIAQKG
jgi:SAM-dependent methyltransferase